MHIVYPTHAARAGVYVIKAGVHICICLWTKKNFESYFSDQLTFSNIHGRTSRRIYRLTLPLHTPDIHGRTSRLIYRLTLPLHTPEMLSSSSKSRIFLYNAHLALFVRLDDTITLTSA